MRIKVGRVFEVRGEDGYGYGAYCGRNPEYGDAVWISNRWQEEPVLEFAGYFAKAFIVFYPLHTAVHLRLVRLLGAVVTVPPVPAVTRRRQGVNGIPGWMIESANQRLVVHNLAIEQAQLPIGSIWLHDGLLRVFKRADWRPELEIDPQRDCFLEGEPRVGPAAEHDLGDSEHQLEYFLYFGTKKNGLGAANAIRGLSADVQIRGPERREKRWLLTVSPSSALLDRTDVWPDRLVEICEIWNGEYDGMSVPLAAKG